MSTKKEKIMFSLEDTVMEKREDNKVERGKNTASKSQTEKSSKERGSEWRKKERPIQKTIHFDEAMHRKINILKQIEGKAIQDLVYDIVQEWMEEHFEEKKKKWMEKI